MQNEIVPIETGDNTLELLRVAVDKLGGQGAEAVVAAIEKLVELKDRVDRRNSEKEFNDALAQFQSECPPIKRASVAKVVTKSGSSYSYNYAELDEIARTVGPFLFSRGLSFTWNSETSDNSVKCTCYLRHRNGHSITATFQAPIPASLGSMNDIQIHAAVLTYLKRQTLVEILGLTTTEIDTDAVSPEKISDEDIEMLKKQITSSGTTEEKFLKFMQADTLADIRKADLRIAILALQRKADKQRTPPSSDSEGRLL